MGLSEVVKGIYELHFVLSSCLLKIYRDQIKKCKKIAGGRGPKT